MGKGLRTGVRTFVFLAATLVLTLITGCANDKGIVREHSDGQLALTLSVDKRKYKEGELITAVATLKNLTSKPLMVHWINIEPAYLSTADPEAVTRDMSEKWRSAYRDRTLNRKQAEQSWRSLLSFIPYENPADTINMYKKCLRTVEHWQRPPAALIPTGTVLTATQEFKATREMNLIDTGLFCNRNWFASEEVTDSGIRVSFPDPVPSPFFVHPEIWTGSLYVSIEIKVE